MNCGLDCGSLICSIDWIVLLIFFSFNTTLCTCAGQRKKPFSILLSFFEGVGGRGRFFVVYRPITDCDRSPIVGAIISLR